MASEPKELVRVLIPDTDAIYGDNENQTLFSDDEIDKFLEVAGDSVLRAAGLAMIAVGNSEALINKVIKTQDLSTDGSKLQDQWRQSGKELMDRADKQDNNDALDYFELIDYQEGWTTDRPELTEYGFTWV